MKLSLKFVNNRVVSYWPPIDQPKPDQEVIDHALENGRVVYDYNNEGVVNLWLENGTISVKPVVKVETPEEKQRKARDAWIEWKMQNETDPNVPQEVKDYTERL